MNRQNFRNAFRRGAALLAIVGLAGFAVAEQVRAADQPATSAQSKVASRYTFSWPVGPTAPAPRGGTTKGAPIELDTAPSAEWRALQEPGISAVERDRRAILAMAGDYRVSFDFLEVAAFTGDGSRARPYQSWGTERVFVDRNEPQHVSLVHVLEMHVIGQDGKPMEPMVTKHWRQDWRYEPAYVVEYQGGERWVRRELAAAERQGKWSQTVYQVDEAPRYGALGRWEHSAAFSSWISNDTARPLPRREWSVRKDYDVLRGTNRHTIVPTGWLQEENNLKAATGAAVPYVGREYGVARYERIRDKYFTEAAKYYESTRAYWNEVLAVWDEIWSENDTVKLKASSDQSGAYADLFQLADDYAAGKLDLADAKQKIRDSLSHQRVAAQTAQATQ
ncbi:MAG TPA: DUF6607 family protein [Povalibacter sp.]|nr:DUF6607 family protein [Povalibacter sp.]